MLQAAPLVSSRYHLRPSLAGMSRSRKSPCHKGLRPGLDLHRAVQQARRLPLQQAASKAAFSASQQPPKDSTPSRQTAPPSNGTTASNSPKDLVAAAFGRKTAAGGTGLFGASGMKPSGDDFSAAVKEKGADGPCDFNLAAAGGHEPAEALKAANTRLHPQEAQLQMVCQAPQTSHLPVALQQQLVRLPLQQAETPLQPAVTPQQPAAPPPSCSQQQPLCSHQQLPAHKRHSS